MDKIIYLISLLLTFLQIVRDGLVIFWKTMVEMFIWIIENVKKHLPTILEMIAYWCVMTLMLVGFLLMMVYALVMVSILDFYDYLYKRNWDFKPQSCLTTSYRLLKIGMWRLKKSLYGLKSHLRLPE